MRRLSKAEPGNQEPVLRGLNPLEAASGCETSRDMPPGMPKARL
jgi:hypothetical protein